MTFILILMIDFSQYKFKFLENDEWQILKTLIDPKNL